jgi:hypothetical protein
MASCTEINRVLFHVVQETASTHPAQLDRATTLLLVEKKKDLVKEVGRSTERNAEKATLAALKCMFVDPGKTYAPVGVKEAIRAALERMEQ